MNKEPKATEVGTVISKFIRGGGTGGQNGSMYLKIVSPNMQYSNGLLLHNNKYHYINAQRYSGEVISSIMTTFANPLLKYSLDYTDHLHLFNRYDILENNVSESIDDDKTEE